MFEYIFLIGKMQILPNRRLCLQVHWFYHQKKTAISSIAIWIEYINIGRHLIILLRMRLPTATTTW